jgi:3-oxoacyl-[acyl-carrier protein] reductase
MFAADAFNDTVTVVTGAAGGMGLATAEIFAAHGGSVVLADRDTERLDAAVAELDVGDRAVAVQLDLADPDSIVALFDRAEEAFGEIDNGVNCAGIMSSVPMDAVTPEIWDTVNAINLRGAFLFTQEAYRRMLPHGRGSVVLVASDAAKRGGGGLIADIPYAASKAGVTSIVKSVSRARAGSGIRINGLCPGASDTPMHSTIDEATKERIAAGIPLGRMGRPLDMARAIAFLSSELASYVYGETINVDGGTVLE